MRLTKNDPRTEALKALYASRGRTGIILNRAANLAWLLGGRVQIGLAGDSGVCTAVINDRGVVIVTNNIEGGRLVAEEFGDVPTLCEVQWDNAAAYAQLVRDAAGADPLKDTECESEMLRLRTILLPEQQLEAEELCQRAARAVTAAAGQVRPGMTEFEISGILSKEGVSEGLIPNVLFTPTDERIRRWRHALSTDKRLEKIAMLSMGAHRNGMYCSITRFVSFGKPDAETLRSQEIVCRVAASMYNNTVPGKQYKTLFAEITDAYANAGAPEQIKLHHQGGLGGFQTRELRIDGSTCGQVHSGQLYAWNPSAPGFKSEDMLLIGDKDNRLLTYTPQFEYRKFECGDSVWSIPQILVL